MDDVVTKLKLKIGIHEFEAEGDPETVKASFEAFRQLVAEAATHQVQPQPAVVTVAAPAAHAALRAEAHARKRLGDE